MVNYTRRFTPKYRELKRFYDMGLYGKAEMARCIFNRGYIHTATHAIDTFNWILGNQVVPQFEYAGQDHARAWSILMGFEKHTWSESRFGNSPVSDMFNYPMWYLAQNTYDFLEGSDDLWCTGDDALKALEICYKLMPEGAR